MVDDRHNTFGTHTGMALPRSLPRLARLALPRAGSVRAASDQPPRRSSCDPTDAPPCPPCTPPPRPPCRARPPERVRALRVTCCPPPRGMRPPCAPPLPACALDCTLAKPRKDCSPCLTLEDCSQGRDMVARRLAAAKDARREDYMREVRERQPPCAPREPSYRMPVERECATATDGHRYTIAPAKDAPTTATSVSRACGPCRERPPPKCVEIVPDNDCQVRRQHYVDPCAHHPRIIVSIDRSKTRDNGDNRNNTVSTEQPHAQLQQQPQPQSHSQPHSQPQTQPHPPQKDNESFTSRIMKGLNLNRSDSGAKCNQPRPSSGAGGKAQYAGDTGWCNTVQPAPAPTKCRPLGEKEKLRRRACIDLPCRQQTPNTRQQPLNTRQQPPNTRQLHTAATAWTNKEPKDMKTIAVQTKANLEKLEKMLNERAQLKEAAKGRTIDCSPKVAIPASGGLELPVPPGSAAVRVQVSLDPSGSACAPPTSKPTSPCAARMFDNKCSAPDTTVNSNKCMLTVPTDEKSWLSIKKIQRKISDTCGMSKTSSKGPSKVPCQDKPSPCAPPPNRRNPCPSSPIPANPCAPLKGASKKSGCDKKKKKPTCFAHALTTITVSQ